MMQVSPGSVPVPGIDVCYCPSFGSCCFSSVQFVPSMGRLLYQIDREYGKCPARGICEGSRENPGSDYYSIIREKPARMFILV